MRDDKVGDAHIVRSVTTQSELDILEVLDAQPRSDVSLVLDALEHELDGPGAAEALPPGLVLADPRAPTLMADDEVEEIVDEDDDGAPVAARGTGERNPLAHGTLDDPGDEVDTVGQPIRPITPLPPPPPGPPVRAGLPLTARADSLFARPSGTPMPQRAPARGSDPPPSKSLFGDVEATDYDPHPPVVETASAPAQPGDPTLLPSAMVEFTPSAEAAVLAPPAPKAKAKPDVRPMPPSVSSSSSLALPSVTPPLAVHKPGLWGDVSYVFAALRGFLAGRREQAQNRERLAVERTGRKKRLVDTARVAVADESVQGSEIAEARERLAWQEEQRARHAAAAQAAEDDATRADEERAAEAKQAGERVKELERAAVAADKRREPLEKEQAERRRALDALRAQVRAAGKRADGIERKIAASQDAGERASLEAELAAARAEKQLAAGEEPARQAAIAELQPKIDAEVAERRRLDAEATATREAAAQADARFVATAKEARARAERELSGMKGAETARDAELEQLGNVLDRDRPASLRTRFRAVDEHAAAIAQIERRQREIEAAASAVDKLALARGLALVLLTLGVVALAVVLALR